MKANNSKKICISTKNEICKIQKTTKMLQCTMLFFFTKVMNKPVFTKIIKEEQKNTRTHFYSNFNKALSSSLKW